MYNHKEIEKKWQKIWDQSKAFKTGNKSDKKYYVLDMFPYPSGSGLHVGHPEGYTATDIIARFKRLKGFDVLHPMGWDAFGLPAEQYAISTGNNPNEFTQKNIATFKKQIKSLGLSYDFDKEVNTTDPKFYEQTQWIFKELYKKGLAVLADIDVNWCEELGTVLANEEVLIDKDGNKVSERGSFPVVKKKMRQWVLKITNYADKLLEGLEDLDWENSLKLLQKNWIGKSTGTKVKFALELLDESIEVFTTRIETIFGATFLTISPEHPLVEKIVTSENKEKVKDFIKEFEKLDDRQKADKNEKNGIFTGSYAINPFNQKKIPIWIGDFVLLSYGTGAIMSVPAHDKRDYEFANKYGLEIKQVIVSKENVELPYLESGHLINSSEFNGLSSKEAIEKLNQYVEKNNLGQVETFYKLRDWIFSRQRYWGEPFPVAFDDENNVYLIDGLVELPFMENIKPSKNGQSPLFNNKKWLYFEKDGKKLTRETNTMPQWAGSNWYYLAYILKNADGSYEKLDSEEAKKRFKKWLPVDLYIGGQEHAVLHLLYSRFWHRFLYDIGVVPTKEPFQKVVNQGMILGTDGQKMSKSRGNIINPSEIVDELGADTLRVYEMFMGPLTDDKDWQVESIKGIRKWLERVYRLFEMFFDGQKTIEKSNEDHLILSQYNKLIKEIENEVELLKFNTAISKLMVFVNLLYKVEKIPSWEILKNFALILSLFAPHIAEELLEKMNQKQVKDQIWPTYDPTYLESNLTKYVIQINGKVRAIVDFELDKTQEEVLAKAMQIEKIKTLLENKNIIKVIFVANKVLNLIVK
ncbi:LEUCYL-TRNA SYNTHETASE (LEUCINE--TRNA LIGASE) [Mycoplasmopsis pulmonis]|uniref:Leucine--tRNA ligase n=1 Tax=Mycoplasmopsis pulmonis (strain UAB CTIP) TaxID=272635 RepID=SYL_MYCPU|nr:leucine--tRNA ligase [Mycoplasmopsis pulmonis]Q98RB6.1 RecName: Full=Leucine--tRNA ligase; AltName: Full=Leucyl-tRNA synthetase; Short=LeuRS [Mycoplasmopsis pulmonis UAB CTIP]CAC13266.1 LEUCYL-TRNA SYNTHETASE (LEUCINE--TRNA LIGASE) [Mycoplasmopsis pulmonis]VEU67858.1 Leucine--tRNA ligase [Mycoplasmopsis pulmonis]